MISMKNLKLTAILSIAVVVALIISAFPPIATADEPQWQAKDVQVVHVYDGHAKTQPSEGVTAAAAGDDLLIALNDKAPWSDVVLSERFPFDLRGVVRADLAAITNGDTTVQVACWDAAGNQLDPVDIFRGIREPGVFEMQLLAYRSAFPPETKDISFRIWIGGKPGAEARYHSLAYGVSTSAVVPPPPAPMADKYEPAKEGTWNLPGEPPFVMAHYVDWFSLEKRLAGKAWDHWSREGPHGHDPANYRPDGLRDIASVVYPLIGPYDTSSRNVARYHLATMHAAGISGIIVDWYGKGSDSDECLPVLLDEAERLGMRVGICFEEKVPCAWSNPKSRAEMLSNAVNDLTYLVNTWAKHPAYLKRNGHPFVMQFNSWGTGRLGPAHLTPDEDRQLLEALPERIELCRQNLDANYHPPVQAGYMWWDGGDRPRKFAQDAAALRDKGRLEFFMSMLGVGFNDTGVWGWGEGPRVSKNYGMDVLRHTETMATDGAPELIQCVTWNDFNEGTCFEPTLQHGFDFIDEVERFIGKLHGRPVNLEDNREPYREYIKTCSDRERQELPKVGPAVLAPKQ
jgi:hypothetical protein